MEQFIKKIKEISIGKLVVLLLLIIIIVAVVSTISMAGLNSAGGPRMSSFGFVEPMGIDMPNAPQSYGVDTIYLPSLPGFDTVENSVPEEKGGSSRGGTEEDFEITDYSATIRTWNLENTCDSFDSLKKKTEVIFTNARRYEHGCSYSFKVEKAHAEEILAFIKEMKPETLNENVQTIKSTIEYYDSEETILKKKLELVEATLLDAQNAYTGVQTLATQTKDIYNLSKIIESKIQLIGQLTTERLNTKTQLDRISQEKIKQLDSLQYTFFNVSVSEIVFIDGKAAKNSWIDASSELARTFNDTVRGITVELLTFALQALRIAIYALIVIVIAEYGWLLLKRIWKGKDASEPKKLFP
ncbi:MAG: hypothetical protein WC878_05150 [Candidatus Paceibacterota bacterium]|jgi:hypothetical protein